MTKKLLYGLAFLIKGWGVSLLLILPLLNLQGKINVFELGILAAAFSIFQLIVSLISGSLAEKFGNKKVMNASIFFYGSSWFLLSLPTSFISLLTACLLGGIATGVFIPLANSQVAKLSDDKNRAKELGDFSAFSDIGIIILSTLTPFLFSKFGLFSVSVSYGISALLSLVFLKDVKITSLVNKPESFHKINLLHLLKIKGFILAVSSGIGDIFASASLYIFIPLLLVPKGIDISNVGLLNGIFFLGYLFGKVLLGRLADKYGKVKILVISEILMASLIFCLIFVNGLILACAVLFILGIFTRGTSPVIRAMVAEAVSDKEKFDKAFSLHSFSLNSSQVAARSIYGFSAGIFGIASVFYISAAVALLTLIPLSAYNRNSK